MAGDPHVVPARRFGNGKGHTKNSWCGVWGEGRLDEGGRKNEGNGLGRLYRCLPDCVSGGRERRLDADGSSGGAGTTSFSYTHTQEYSGIHSHRDSATEAVWRNSQSNTRQTRRTEQVRLCVCRAELRGVKQPSESNGRRGAWPFAA